MHMYLYLQQLTRLVALNMNEWMNKHDLRDAITETVAGALTVQKVSSQMALSVSEETGESLDADRRKPATM